MLQLSLAGEFLKATASLTVQNISEQTTVIISLTPFPFAEKDSNLNVKFPEDFQIVCNDLTFSAAYNNDSYVISAELCKDEENWIVLKNVLK